MKLYEQLFSDTQSQSAWNNKANIDNMNLINAMKAAKDAAAAEKRDAAARKAAANAAAASGGGSNNSGGGSGGTIDYSGGYSGPANSAGLANNVNSNLGRGTESWNWDPTSGPVAGNQLVTIKTDAGRVTVNKQTAKDFGGFLNELVGRGYGPIKQLDGYEPRKMRSGPSWSSHAGGYAIDLNYDGANPVSTDGVVRTNFPPWIGALSKKYNLVWGGNWRGKTSDPMHFSWMTAR